MTESSFFSRWVAIPLAAFTVFSVACDKDRKKWVEPPRAPSPIVEPAVQTKLELKNCPEGLERKWRIDSPKSVLPAPLTLSLGEKIEIKPEGEENLILFSSASRNEGGYLLDGSLRETTENFDDREQASVGSEATPVDLRKVYFKASCEGGVLKIDSTDDNNDDVKFEITVERFQADIAVEQSIGGVDEEFVQLAVKRIAGEEIVSVNYIPDAPVVAVFVPNVPDPESTPDPVNLPLVLAPDPPAPPPTFVATAPVVLGGPVPSPAVPPAVVPPPPNAPAAVAPPLPIVPAGLFDSSLRGQYMGFKVNADGSERECLVTIGAFAGSQNCQGQPAEYVSFAERSAEAPGPINLAFKQWCLSTPIASRVDVSGPDSSILVLEEDIMIAVFNGAPVDVHIARSNISCHNLQRVP